MLTYFQMIQILLVDKISMGDIRLPKCNFLSVYVCSPAVEWKLKRYIHMFIELPPLHVLVDDQHRVCGDDQLELIAHLLDPKTAIVR